MLPYSALLDIFRTPLIRKNRKAVRFLSDVFYLLLALYRTGRIEEFNWLKWIYFEMINSFAEYGQYASREGMKDLQKIPWISQHNVALLRIASSYKRVIEKMHSQPDCHNISPLAQMEINEGISHFVDAFKVLINFDDQDEQRVEFLVQHPEIIDESLKQIRAVEMGGCGESGTEIT